jgi:hypothetical protein
MTRKNKYHFRHRKKTKKRQKRQKRRLVGSGLWNWWTGNETNNNSSANNSLQINTPEKIDSESESESETENETTQPQGADEEQNPISLTNELQQGNNNVDDSLQNNTQNEVDTETAEPQIVNDQAINTQPSPASFMNQIQQGVNLKNVNSQKQTNIIDELQQKLQQGTSGLRKTETNQTPKQRTPGGIFADIENFKFKNKTTNIPQDDQTQVDRPKPAVGLLGAIQQGKQLRKTGTFDNSTQNQISQQPQSTSSTSTTQQKTSQIRPRRKPKYEYVLEGLDETKKEQVKKLIHRITYLESLLTENKILFSEFSSPTEILLDIERIKKLLENERDEFEVEKLMDLFGKRNQELDTTIEYKMINKSNALFRKLEITPFQEKSYNELIQYVPKDLLELSIDDLEKRGYNKLWARRMLKEKECFKFLLENDKVALQQIYLPDLKKCGYGLDIYELAAILYHFPVLSAPEKSAWQKSLISKFDEMYNKKQFNYNAAHEAQRNEGLTNILTKEEYEKKFGAKTSTTQVSPQQDNDQNNNTQINTFGAQLKKANPKTNPNPNPKTNPNPTTKFSPQNMKTFQVDDIVSYQGDNYKIIEKTGMINPVYKLEGVTDSKIIENVPKADISQSTSGGQKRNHKKRNTRKKRKTRRKRNKRSINKRHRQY